VTETPEPLPNEGLTVTEDEIASAMAVNSVPDEVRVHGTFRDETDQVIDGTGVLGPPAEQEPSA
jgi:hypothetical protein